MVNVLDSQIDDIVTRYSNLLAEIIATEDDDEFKRLTKEFEDLDILRASLKDKQGSDPETIVSRAIEEIASKDTKRAARLRKVVELPKVEKSHASDSKDLFFLLKFSSLDTMKRIQDLVKESLADNSQEIVWEEPDNFHVTLVFVPEISNLDSMRLSTLIDMSKPVDVQVDGFGTFDNGSHTLFLNVSKTPELVNLQQDLANLMVREGFELSPFSVPEDWKSHITIATSDEPFDMDELPEFGGLGLAGETIEASVNFQVLNWVEKFNPHHKPAGTPEGGQFTTATGTGGRDIRHDEDLTDALNFGDGVEEDISAGANASFKFTNLDGEEFHVKLVDEEQRDNEIAARQLAEELGVDNVPEIWDVSSEDPEITRVATEWVEGRSWSQLTDQERLDTINNLDSVEYTKLVTYEYLIDNLDRHTSNLMVTDDGKIVLIDNGISFGLSSPDWGIGATRRNAFLTDAFSVAKPLDVSILRDMTSGKRSTASIRILTQHNVTDRRIAGYSARFAGLQDVLQLVEGDTVNIQELDTLMIESAG